MKKFGFIGLGEMGSAIVKTILDAGHDVVIWDKSEEKATDLFLAGAEFASNPSQLVEMVDVVFMWFNKSVDDTNVSTYIWDYILVSVLFFFKKLLDYTFRE